MKSDSKDEIKYAVIQNLRNGKVYNVHAKAIVIACNATLTPQLLYNSGFSPDYPALGKYICEQPLAFCQIVLKKEIVDEIRREEKIAPNNMIDDIPIPIKDPPPQVNIIYICEDHACIANIKYLFTVLDPCF